jgi:3',5'-cyclic AMP phosphodiesterase CpdA
VIGNHEYLDDTEHDSAAGHFTYFGAAAGDPAKGYYTFPIGQWQAFVLNSGDLGFNTGPDDCFPVSCAAGSPQEQWLRTELAALPPDKCVVAAIHHPHHASDTARDHPDVLAPIYDALYDNGVELLLSGHSHTYERFQPMSNGTTVDSNFGVVEFVVGTGGRSLFTEPATKLTGSQKFDNDAFGELELTLAAGRYDFRYLHEDGTVFDSGGASCHRPHA